MRRGTLAASVGVCGDAIAERDNGDYGCSEANAGEAIAAMQSPSGLTATIGIGIAALQSPNERTATTDQNKDKSTLLNNPKECKHNVKLLKMLIIEAGKSGYGQKKKQPASQRVAL